MKPCTNWRYFWLGLTSVALAAVGCGEEQGGSAPLGQKAQRTESQCGWVPDEFIDRDDGCDCPLNGATECDPDCSENGAASWCGCDFCFDDSGNEVTEPPEHGNGELCDLVPTEYLGVGDGCDCPADGDLSCDADCDSGNVPAGYCGCQYCYPEEPPDDDPDPPPDGGDCDDVPEEYIDERDGCDCPATGDLTCDPDCAEDNVGGGYCGCEYCYPEEPPDGGTAEPGEVYTVTLELPEGMSLCELHLYASEDLTLASNVTGAGAVIGWSRANVGAHSGVEALASAGPVTVSAGASVAVASGSSLTGTAGRFVAHQESHAREEATWEVLVPPGNTPDVSASASTSSLAPGRYGAVSVPSGATLSFAPGAYYLASLDIGAGGGLMLSSEGTTVLHVLDEVSFAGEVQRVSHAELVLIYLGSERVVLEASLDGTLLAPFAELELAQPVAGGHTGAFLAKDLAVAAHTSLSRLPANPLVPHFTSDPERCARHVCGVDLSDQRARELALALHCLSADDVCQAEMQAIANVDYRIAAAKVVTREFTPGRYQAVSRDRSRKLRIGRSSAGYPCAVTAGDADADLVPDGQDLCPATPELTPTDDEGCPEPIPAGPDPDQVAAILDEMNVSVASHCAGTRPPAPGDLSGLWSVEPELSFTFDFDSGEQCPVFYEVKFERRFALVTDANGVPLSDFLQFMVPPDSVASVGPGRVRLTFVQATDVPGVAEARGFGHDGTHRYFRYRVRAITPDGMKSPWSQWSAWTFKEY